MKSSRQKQQREVRSARPIHQLPTDDALTTKISSSNNLESLSQTNLNLPAQQDKHKQQSSYMVNQSSSNNNRVAGGKNRNKVGGKRTAFKSHLNVQHRLKVANPITTTTPSTNTQKPLQRGIGFGAATASSYSTSSTNLPSMNIVTLESPSETPSSSHIVKQQQNAYQQTQKGGKQQSFGLSNANMMTTSTGGSTTNSRRNMKGRKSQQSWQRGESGVNRSKMTRKREGQVCSVLVHCYDSFQKLPQKTDQECSVLFCETELDEQNQLNSSQNQINPAKTAKNKHQTKKETKEKEISKENSQLCCAAEDDSDEFNCLVANEQLVVDQQFSARKKLQAQVSLINSYKRRLVETRPMTGSKNQRQPEKSAADSQILREHLVKGNPSMQVKKEISESGVKNLQKDAKQATTTLSLVQQFETNLTLRSSKEKPTLPQKKQVSNSFEKENLVTTEECEFFTTTSNQQALSSLNAINYQIQEKAPQTTEIKEVCDRQSLQVLRTLNENSAEQFQQQTGGTMTLQQKPKTLKVEGVGTGVGSSGVEHTRTLSVNLPYATKRPVRGATMSQNSLQYTEKAPKTKQNLDSQSSSYGRDSKHRQTDQIFKKQNSENVQPVSKTAQKKNQYQPSKNGDYLFQCDQYQQQSSTTPSISLTLNNQTSSLTVNKKENCESSHQEGQQKNYFGYSSQDATNLALLDLNLRKEETSNDLKKFRDEKEEKEEKTAKIQDKQIQTNQSNRDVQLQQSSGDDHSISKTETAVGQQDRRIEKDSQIISQIRISEHFVTSDEQSSLGNQKFENDNQITKEEVLFGGEICPENISECEADEVLGLGILLEDQRHHFLMEKLSNRFAPKGDTSFTEYPSQIVDMDFENNDHKNVSDSGILQDLSPKAQTSSNQVQNNEVCQSNFESPQKAENVDEAMASSTSDFVECESSQVQCLVSAKKVVKDLFDCDEQIGQRSLELSSGKKVFELDSNQINRDSNKSGDAEIEDLQSKHEQKNQKDSILHNSQEQAADIEVEKVKSHKQFEEVILTVNESSADDLHQESDNELILQLENMQMEDKSPSKAIDDALEESKQLKSVQLSELYEPTIKMGHDEFPNQHHLVEDVQNRHSRALIPQKSSLQSSNQLDQMSESNPWKKSMKTLVVQQPVDPPFIELTQKELLAQKVDFEADFYARMLSREFQHRLQKDYFTWQLQMNKLMRVTLLCWIDEMCAESRFQRTTFYMSLAYIDKFFEKAPRLYGPDELQLVGVTAVYLASKMEEVFVPPLKYYAKATQYSSSEAQIIAMERTMIEVIEYRLHPVTLLSWVDWFTKQWDSYANSSNMHALAECQDISFRSFSLHSYNRYRTLLNLLDAVAIDFRGQEMAPRQIVAALIYLVVGSQTGMAVFPNNYQIALQYSQEAPISDSVSLFEQQSVDSKIDPQIEFFNSKVYEPYLLKEFGLQLHQIRNSVMYVAKFFALNLDLEAPDCSQLGEDPEWVKIEEYLGLQTKNDNLQQYLDWMACNDEHEKQKQAELMQVQQNNASQQLQMGQQYQS